MRRSCCLAAAAVAAAAVTPLSPTCRLTGGKMAGASWPNRTSWNEEARRSQREVWEEGTTQPCELNAGTRNQAPNAHDSPVVRQAHKLEHPLAPRPQTNPSVLSVLCIGAHGPETWEIALKSQFVIPPPPPAAAVHLPAEPAHGNTAR